MRLLFIRETQISKTQCIEICKLNNPAEGGGFNTPQLCCGISFQSLLWCFIPVIVLLFLLSFQLKAQHYTRDAGFRAGTFSAVCYRQYLNDNKHWEIMAGLKRNAIRVTYMREYVQPALHKHSPNLFFIYGFGVHTGISRMDYYRVFTRTYYYDDYRYSPVIGMDGYLGLEYRFSELPFIIGIDFKPFFEFSTTQFFNLILFDSAFILKYKF
ncbi:MAG: hypothetical protein JW973_10690 [Bacteroidales bacterium]|nr:hypothetical protein [Bacteroidales bacterium]